MDLLHPYTCGNIHLDSKNITFDMAYKQLIMDEGYSEDKIKLMVEIMELSNLRYFAGIENLNLRMWQTQRALSYGQIHPKAFLKAIF
jgi:hypothetical protein